MSALPTLTLAEITALGIDPALKLLPCKMDTPEARVQLLAIGLQESRFAYRRQVITVTRKNKQGIAESVSVAEGPAKSFWQGERGGGMVHGVRTHPATKAMANVLYEARQVKPTDTAIWNAIENDDVLAAGLARLLIYTDPHPLPALGDAQRAWDYYLRTWRPGKPHRLTWDALYRRALEFVTGRDL
jgi:hypothetical protein